MKLESLGESLTTGLLVAAGSIGIALGAADIFGLDQNLTDKSLLSILLSLVSVVSLSLGLERAVHQRRLWRQLADLERLASSQTGGRLLQGMPEISAAVLRAIARANRCVRILVPQASLARRSGVADALIRRLVESRQTGAPVYAEVVYVVAPEQAEEFLAVAEAQLSRFRSAGVDHRLDLRVLSAGSEACVEMAMVDDEDVFLLFPMLNGGDVQAGLAFENQPALCRGLAAWFDNRLQDAAVSYKSWRSTGAAGSSAGERAQSGLH